MYLAFYLRKIFEATPKLDEVFTFWEDFAHMLDLLWQHEAFDLVTVTNTGELQISVTTPSCGPSSNVGLLAQSSPGYGLAQGGFGFLKSQARPKLSSGAWPGLALAQAAAFMCKNG
jgi:hypothetical protein